MRPRSFRTGPAGTHAACKEDPIDTLTSKQRAHLRSLAHHLKPVLQVGGEGVTEAMVGALEEALATRELLKVKVLESAPVHARQAAEVMRERVPGSAVVQVIGRTVVIYRPFPEAPEIRLPS